MVFHKGGPVSTGQAGSWYRHHWYPALPLLPDNQRVMPITVPHEIIRWHRVGCACVPCQQYDPKLLSTLRSRNYRKTPPEDPIKHR